MGNGAKGACGYVLGQTMFIPQVDRGWLRPPVSCFLVWEILEERLTVRCEVRGQMAIRSVAKAVEIVTTCLLCLFLR